MKKHYALLLELAHYLCFQNIRLHKKLQSKSLIDDNEINDRGAPRFLGTETCVILK